MSIKAVLADDEPAARSRLRKLLAPLDDVDIVGEAGNGVEAVSLIARLRPELLFLDVQMPGLDGFEVLRSLPRDVAWPLVIFATAFDQYALAAFEANAVGYLLKPINRDRLGEAVDRARQILASERRTAEERSQLEALSRSTVRPLGQVVARTRNRYVLVPIDEVCFFRVEDGLTFVATATAQYRTDYAIGDLEARLPDPPFLRAHRGAIVNMRMVAEILPLLKGTYALVMKDRPATEIQVSERQSRLVRDLLHSS
jgi:DNA-binding LytR/AlgR family response regulator